MISLLYIMTLASQAAPRQARTQHSAPMAIGRALASSPKPRTPDLIVSAASDLCISPVLLLGIMQLTAEKRLSPEAVLQDAQTFGSRLHDYQYSTGDPIAANVIRVLQLEVPEKGTCDYSDAFWSLSESLATQADPYRQRKVADLLGIPTLMVALRGGEAELRRGVEQGRAKYDTGDQ